MLRTWMGAVALAALTAGSAGGAEKLQFGPPSAWVKPVQIPKTTPGEGLGAAQFLLQDSQVRSSDEGEEVYFESATKLLTPESLTAGNLQLPWDPAKQTVTVHKLHIIRGDQVIDVLKNQQFTVLRRENNLERAALDGTLTAALQPEDLEVGDIIDLAATIKGRDPALKGHVETALMPLAGVDVERVHLRAVWSKSRPMHWRQTDPIGDFKTSETPNGSEVELTVEKRKGVKPPEDAPARFRQPAMMEGTDFASWADASSLMSDLYEDAARLRADSPLKGEAARIKAASADPSVQATLALQLVESRVRYLFLGIDGGGYKPAAADLTWSRKYGDCKGKTVLLLALLHEIGIAAQPALISTERGDGLDAHLPVIGLFDHVMVRTVVGGKVRWLDATRTGDRSLDDLTVPAFSWALPVQAKGGALEKLVVAPLDKPSMDTSIRIDATAGLDAPAPAHLETVFTGDAAAAVRMVIANATQAEIDKSARDYWTNQYSWFEPKSARAEVDAATGVARYVADGAAKMNWERSDVGTRRYDSDLGTIGWNADFHREAGPKANAPYAIGFPMYTRAVETVILPNGGAGFTYKGSDLDVTVAGRTLRQKVSLEKGVFRAESSSRSLAPEFPSSDAPAAEARLRELNKAYVYVLATTAYTPTSADLTAAGSQPETFETALAHGFDALRAGRPAEAKAKFDQAVKLQPQSAMALAARGQARLFDEDLAGGAADLDAALKLDPDNKLAVVNRANLYLMQKQAARGIDLISQAIARNPKDPEFLFARVTFYGMDKQTDLALKDLDTLGALLPNDPRLRGSRLELYWSTGDFAAYLRTTDEWVKQSPYDAEALNFRAVALAKLGRRDEALKQYSDSISVKPTAMAYAGRAELRPDDQMEAALADVDAALKLAPDDGRARAVKYQRLMKAGRLDQAFAEMDVVAKEQASNPLVLNNICYAKAMKNYALESALAQCDAALKISPSSAFILDSRGFVKLRLGRLDAAITDYDAALKGRKVAESFYGRGIAKLRKGDRAGGKADLEQARKLTPAIDQTFKTYGVTPPA